ncbi:hypothetical protein EC988_002317 [Linderina pennispora]|nr:hypothetical protein EC988_002317 [Linderina pennispora]
MTEREFNARFVSEDTLSEAKKEREEAWRQAYKTEPVPEPSYDPRTLYERLQEQKRKKEDEFMESHRLSKQIRLLDQDETEFLEAIDDQEHEKNMAKRRRDMLEAAEFQRMVAEKRTREVPKKPTAKRPVAKSLVSRIAVVVKEVKADPKEPRPEPKEPRPDPEVVPKEPSDHENPLSVLASYPSDSETESEE